MGNIFITNNNDKIIENKNENINKNKNYEKDDKYFIDKVIISKQINNPILENK